MAKSSSSEPSRRKTVKNEINFDVLASETVRALRGRQSQQQASREMGFSFNQFGKWEGFEKRILWSDLIRLLEMRKISLVDSLMTMSLGRQGVKASDLLRELKADLSAVELAKRLGYPRVQFSRWLAGTTDVPLAEMLRIFQKVRNGAAQFINKLLPNAAAPKSLRDSMKTLNEYSFYLDAPWIGLIHLAIDDGDCPPAPRAARFLSKLLGVPLEVVQDALDRMRLYGILEIDEAGRYVTSSRIMLSSHRRRSVVFHRHWADTVSEAFDHLPEDEQLSLTDRNFFTSLIIGVNPKVWSEIVARYRNFLESVRQIIVEDTDSPRSLYKILVFQALDVQQAGQVMNLSRPAKKRTGLANS